MTQTFKTEGQIKATLTRINSRGSIRYDWVIEDEKNSCNSCLICSHYKYNHNNIAKNNSKHVHNCLVKAPVIIDITNELHVHGSLVDTLTKACLENFSRRAIG